MKDASRASDKTGQVDLLQAPGHLIRRAQQRHQAKWSEIVGGGITSVQFAVLALLDSRPGLDQRTMAASLSIDTSTLADVCVRLVERGLVARSRAAEDARRNRLDLTPAGRRTLRRAIPAVDAVGDALLAPLEPQERKQLMGLLRRLIEPPPPAQPEPPEPDPAPAAVRGEVPLSPDRRRTR